MTCDKIVKMNSEGLELQRKLKATHTRGGPNGSMASPGEEGSQESKDKESLGQGPFKVAKTVIPVEITDIIGKDWDFVNKKHHLHKLPAAVTAHDVIGEFRKVYRKKKLVGLGVFDQFVDGLIKALDAYIGRGLLYRFERPQLLEVSSQHPGRPLSHIYGPIVLLRYLCKKNTIHINVYLIFL